MPATALTKLAKRIALHLPGLRDVVQERDRLREELAARDHAAFVPPGHFYSPFADVARVRREAHRLFPDPPRTLAAVDLREAGQLALLERLATYYPEMPFPVRKTPGRRYCFENGAYSYSDAILLYCMIRHLRPRRIVEIGSGWSSCATLDTNALFFDGRIACTFIEPFPALLRSLLEPGDADAIEILPVPLQDVSLDCFTALEANDVLFVDSTHVSKIGSDVNRLFFEILPALAPGVHVHFHDVFHPFEYPRAWVEEGRAWTEAYLLRAFLAFNDTFRIVLFNTFLEHFHADWFRRHMPLCLENPGGSIWLARAR